MFGWFLEHGRDGHGTHRRDADATFGLTVWVAPRLFFAVMLVLPFLLLATPQLLDKARLVMEVGNWEEIQVSIGKYVWWSPNRILAFVSPTEQRLIDADKGTFWPCSFPLVDKWGYASLSPDRSLVVTAVDSKEPTITWQVTDPGDLQAAGTWRSKSEPLRGPISADFGYPAPAVRWSQDGQSLYEVACSSDGQGVQVQVGKRKLRQLSKETSFPVQTDLPYGISVEVFDDRALAIPYQRYDLSKFSLVEWALADPVKTKRVWDVKPPKGQVFLAYQPSPDFKHALWTLTTAGSGDSTFTDLPFTAISLWVSDLHGGGMKELGEIPLSQDAGAGGYANFGGVDWNPDSKRVSFIFRRKLYLVSAGF